MSYQPLFTKTPVPKNKTLKKFSREEVEKHNKEGDLWVIVDHFVYDISSFGDMHPGGLAVLLDSSVAGKDATQTFFSLHKGSVLTKYARLMIGTIEGEESKYLYEQVGQLSQVPYGEPMWLTPGYHNPYYTEAHRKLALAVRHFVESEVIPEARSHEMTGERPSVELIKKMADNKINFARLGPGKHLHGITLPGGMKGEDFDFLGELIISQELARIGARGYQDGLQAGMWIGLTPILNFGTQKMKDEIIPPVLAGDKFICLAISDPFAGSDVAGLQATAKKSPDGKHWIINGTKKWITNGMFADYFTTAVKTSEKGMSMILIPRVEGVETKKIITSYSPSAGTALVTFDNVKVPIENLIGEENKGLHIVLSNFNHERWNMTVMAIRQIRQVTEQCFKWAHVRYVFGKPLINQPVIRAKFGLMFAKAEALQAYLESVTWQMCKMTYAEQSDLLAGQIAILKAYTTRVATEIADEAVQIFGGRGITKGGMGELVELYQRSFKFDSILGGSEEVLLDLGVRQAMRKMPKVAL